LWAGCKTHSATTPLSSGYEEVSHPVHTFIAANDPLPPRTSLQYRGTNNVVTQIWPSLYGVNEVFKGDLALFVGDKASAEPDPVIRPRLFAAKPGELPLDITDEVLLRWSKMNNKNFNVARNRFAMITPEENGDTLDLHLEFASKDTWMGSRDDWPNEGTVQLDWQQVEAMMHAVKTKGVPMHDLRWNSAYIGEKF
jgi:hypothetical protein